MRLACLVLVLLVGCSNPVSPIDAACASVVGGQPVTGASPVIRLGVGGCSAVLIAPDVILTAAHCVNSTESEISGHEAVVRKFYPHPKADSRRNDIAVGVLSQPLIGVPVATIGEAGLGEATLIGFGLDEEGTRAHRSASVYIDEINEYGIITAPGAGSCYGDSGGGLFIDDTLVGIVSASLSQECGNGSFYTPVADYTDWIASISGDLAWSC